MSKYTTHRIRCKKHDLDKAITYPGVAKKVSKYIKEEMAKYSCNDYKVTTRIEELADD